MRSVRAFCLDFPYMGQERGTLNTKINVEYLAVMDVSVTCKPNGVSGNDCIVTIDSVVWYGIVWYRMVWRLAVGSIERNCWGYRFEVSTVGCVCVCGIYASCDYKYTSVHEVKIPF